MAEAPVDFVILDDQSEANANELARLIRTLGETPSSPLHETRVVHLYTPTTNRSMATGSMHDSFGSIAPTSGPVTTNVSSSTNIAPAALGLVKMTKPPRQARLLQFLAGLKDLLPSSISFNSGTRSETLAAQVAQEQEKAAAARRTLFGNVLIAEDNPIAQNLLVKQLQRYDLNVVATSNGEEAIAAWEKHPPGYFSLALFDHRESLSICTHPWTELGFASDMPVCDGVEAAKRVRTLEGKRKVSVMLPSESWFLLTAYFVAWGSLKLQR
jgi:CheY-like chemotaxis protein